MEIILSPCHSLCYIEFMPVILIFIEKEITGGGGGEEKAAAI